jgi:NAD(P)-dependent dehydrogenase (short-subunit alcohol dehydrogenase family)
MNTSLIAVVTGTSRGIGLEMVSQLLSSGNKVYACARNPEKSKDLMDLKKKHSDSLMIAQVDVNSDEQVDAFAKTLKGGIDLLINNAGVYGENSSFEKLSLETVETTFTNNAVAPMRVTRALLPALQKSKHATVLHVTSLMGSIQDNESGGSYGYRMSKVALNMFNKSFSCDYPGITSVVVHPGWVKTDMGGSNAPVEVADSAKGILKIALSAKSEMNGKFYDFEGDELPW